MSRVLLIKTSSLGDVVHTLPAVQEASQHGFTFDWVVEPAFAEIAQLHPAVQQIIPFAWRTWRSNVLAHQTAMRTFYRQLRARSYDCVLDAQGLIKSAAVSALAKGRRVGFSHTTAREPWAAFVYGRGVPIARGQHAIERQRQLFAAALGYASAGEASSGLRPTLPAASVHGPVVLLHGTTWPTKHWPVSMWQALTRQVIADGYEVLVTWGSPAEQARAAQLAEVGARVVPKSSLAELARLLQSAVVVIGVDSGLTHFAAALGAPTLGLYGPTSAVLTGARGGQSVSLQATTNCSPCVAARCRRYQGSPQHWQGEPIEPPCFATLPPDHVWQQAKQLMAAGS